VRRGFTLIELMVVVLIVGILSAIAIPKYADVTESAKYAACRSNLRNIAGGLNMYLSENGSYPPGNGWKKLNTLSEYVHQEMMCPSTESEYRYRIMGGERDTFRIRGWVAACRRNHGWYKDGVYLER